MRSFFELASSVMVLEMIAKLTFRLILVTVFRTQPRTVEVEVDKREA